MRKPPKRRTKGSGSIRQRGRIWWVTYYAGGLPVAESSHSADKDVATKLLQKRIGELASGQETSPEKATINDLYRLVVEDYKLNKNRDLKTVQWRYRANIEPAIGSMLASRFGPAHVRNYVSARRAAGASDPTINRELSIVRRGFVLGYQEDPPLVRKVPHILKLDEDNARQGFIVRDQYEKLLAAVPERMKAMFVVAYHVGTRKGEVRKIRWDQVDFESGKIWLEKAQTKGKARRGLPIYGDMEYWLLYQRERCPQSCPWVFFYNGRPVGAQLQGWRDACVEAGVPALLFHDLRRTAVRNMRLAGVGQEMRMKISGHRTATMESRYNILDDTDLDAAAKKMEEFHARESSKPKIVKIK